MKKGADGFSEVCKICYKARYCEYRRLKRELEKKNKPISRTIYDGFKPFFVTKAQLRRWELYSPDTLRCVLQCKLCKNVLDVDTFTTTMYGYFCPHCDCNIIYEGSINYLNAFVLYKSRKMRNNSLFKFDKYR